jgi:hypothetical protein
MSETHVQHLWSTLWLFLVNAFLMPCQVIDRPEPFLASAIWLITFE